MNENFFKNLFDFSFRRFITPQVSGIFYGLAVVVIGLFSLILLFALFPLSLIVSPVLFIVLIVLARMSIESTVALMRIAENSSLLVDLERKRWSGSIPEKPLELQQTQSNDSHTAPPNEPPSSVDDSQSPSAPM